MARPRAPIGPLLDLNLPRVSVDKLNALSTRIQQAGLPNTVLSERVEVDEQGRVTRMMELCRHCQGICCASLRIPITRNDARRLAEATGVSMRSLPLLPPTGEEDPEEHVYGYLSQGESPCPYFDKGCSVHEHRPDVCRGFGLMACAGAEVFRPLESLVRRRRASSRA